MHAISSSNFHDYEYHVSKFHNYLTFFIPFVAHHYLLKKDFSLNPILIKDDSSTFINICSFFSWSNTSWFFCCKKQKIQIHLHHDIHLFFYESPIRRKKNSHYKWLETKALHSYIAIFYLVLLESR